MKILALAPQWPDPPRQGAAIRNLHILRYLAARRDVTLLTFTPEGGEIDRSGLEELRHSEVFELPSRPRIARLRTLATPGEADMAWRLRSPEMWARVGQLCEAERFDAVHVEGIEMAPYGLMAIRSGAGWMTYDAHNAEYLLQRRAFTTDVSHLRRIPKAAYSLVQWWRLRQLERVTSLESRHVLAVSREDKAALARLSPRLAERITVLPNGVDPGYWSPNADFDAEGVTLPPHSLVFDGTMDFRPNIDAALWFVERVWPGIRAEQPEARFYIVGRSPAREVLALAREPGVVVTGSVPDTRPYVAQASVYVVPMRMGGGVRLKLLQAMSMARPVVSTRMGAEGIDVENGRHLLITSSPQPFASAVLKLWRDPALATRLGQSARAHVERHYAWQVVLPTLDKVYG